MSADLPAAAPDATETLIQRCLRGDQLAWDLIVGRHWRMVFNVAYKFVGKYDEAEDLTQDIFLKIFKSLDTFDRRANFQTWLMSVSRNLCIDHYRRVRKERETIDRDVDASELSPISREQSQVDALEQRDRVVLLRHALSSLPETLRTAVVMRDIQEVTAKRELERSFEDIVKEIQHLIDQMNDGERRAYLAESLFLNTVKYENDKLEAYMKKLTKK